MKDGPKVQVAEWEIDLRNRVVSLEAELTYGSTHLARK